MCSMNRARRKPHSPSADDPFDRLVKQALKTAGTMKRRSDLLTLGTQFDLPYALPKGLLDQELKILGELSDVAAMLAEHMRERGVPEDDPDLMMVEARRRRFAKNAAWVLSEKAREAEEKAAWIKASRAKVVERVRVVRLPKPDVAEDPTTIH